MTKAVEEVAASLVREYLNRKGLKKTLHSMDEELPRTNSSINNRTDLCKILNLGALYKKNKLQEFPLKSMLEIIVKQHMETNGDETSNFSSEQVITKELGSLGKSTPTTLSQSRRYNTSDNERGKCTEGDNFTVLQPKVRLSQTPEECNTEHGRAAVSRGAVSEDERKSRRMPFAQDSGDVSSGTSVHSKSGPADNQRNRNSRTVRGMMAGPVASYAQECNKKRELRKSGGCSLSQAKDEGKLDLTAPDSHTNLLEGEEPQAHFDFDRVSKRLQSPHQKGRNIVDTTDISDSFQRLKTGGKTIEKTKSTLMNKDQDQKAASAATSPKADNLNHRSSITLDDYNDEEEVNELSFRPVIYNAAEASFHSHPIDQKMAEALKDLLFGSSMRCFNKEWKAQSFTFSDLPHLRYGIAQKKGGPCGVLASVQAWFMQKLLFEETISGLGRHPSDAVRRKCLLTAIAEILWRAGDKERAAVAISSGRKQFIPAGKYKSDGILETITVINVKGFEDLKLLLDQHIMAFESGPFGCILLTLSAILSRSVEMVRADFDVPTNTLIGSHGYCTQELVNLLLCGQAVSNVFDNNFELNSGNGNITILKGIKERSDVGFLSLFEHYNICKVGSYLKSPRFPVWVVCSESHFSVLFCVHRELVINRNAQSEFDLYYYDGLANQQEEIKLTISTGWSGIGCGDADTDLIPPLEHCIRTKWKDATVNWNETEPIL